MKEGVDKFKSYYDTCGFEIGKDMNIEFIAYNIFDGYYKITFANDEDAVAFSLTFGKRYYEESTN